MSQKSVFVHESAIVEDGSTIGLGSNVWHFAHVRDGAVIGSDCTLSKGVFVDGGAVVGDNCKIQNHVSIFNGVTLGDSVMVGPSAVFTNDLRPRVVGNWKLTTTSVGDGVGIGANSTIVCGVDIGDWAMVGAGAVVISDVPAHALVVGNPARVIGWVNKAGDIVSRSSECPEGIEDK